MINPQLVVTEQDKYQMEQLWFKFCQCQFEAGFLAQDFKDFYGDTIFPKGTTRVEVQNWFDDIYPDGVEKLLEMCKERDKNT